MEGTATPTIAVRCGKPPMDGLPSSALPLREASPVTNDDHLLAVANAERSSNSGPIPDHVGIPAILTAASQEQLHQHFREEYQPVGPTERALVGMLAQHAAWSERWELGGGALGRQTARHLPELLQGPAPAGDSPGEFSDDAVLAGTFATDAVDRCERHTMRRSREFLRVLETLKELQAARRGPQARESSMPPLGFIDEAACEQYLAERLERGLVSCPQCGATAGWMIASRKRRECRDCQHQLGLRSSTVMACSPVSLRQWFDAIRRVLWQPSLSAAELGKQIGVPRLATVRSMRQKIRSALAAEDASERLAGLDQHFAMNFLT